MNMVITIDGPAGSGKSTVAKIAARKLGYAFLDTGAYFRALMLKIIRAGADPADEKTVVSLFDKTMIALDGERVLLDGKDVSAEIRKPGIAEKVAPLASSPAVRKRMLKRWRAFASEKKNIVTEGRDQGTAAFPKARFKFFLNASIEERTRRRYKELRERGTPVDFNALRLEIMERDDLDRNRNVSPLVKPTDAVEIDTTGRSIEQVVSEILGRIAGGAKGRE